MGTGSGSAAWEARRGEVAETDLAHPRSLRVCISRWTCAVRVGAPQEGRHAVRAARRAAGGRVEAERAGRWSSDGDEGDEGLAGRRSTVGVGVEAVGGRSSALDRPLSGRGGAGRTRLREGREALRASESRSLPRLVPATGPRGEQPVAFPASMAHRLDRSPTRELASIPASARAANRSQSRARRSARVTTTSRTEGVAAQKPQQSVPDLIY